MCLQISGQTSHCTSGAAQPSLAPSFQATARLLRDGDLRGAALLEGTSVAWAGRRREGKTKTLPERAMPELFTASYSPAETPEVLARPAAEPFCGQDLLVDSAWWGAPGTARLPKPACAPAGLPGHQTPQPETRQASGHQRAHKCAARSSCHCGDTRTHREVRYLQRLGMFGFCSSATLISQSSIPAASLGGF